jgi:hypothetical protein
VPFPSPTGSKVVDEAVADSLAVVVGEGDSAVLTAPSPSPIASWLSAKASPTGATWLSAKSPLPTNTSPTGLRRQEKRNPVGEAFTDSAKRPFLVVTYIYEQNKVF